MKRLGKLFNRKKTYNNNCNHELLIIDDNAQHLHTILGITEERADELTRKIVQIYHRNNFLHMCLKEAVTECKHTNEVVFATLVTHRVVEKHNSSDFGNFLQRILANG